MSIVAVQSLGGDIGDVASAEVHGYWDVVHGWGSICGVIVLGAASLLVAILTVVLEEGSSRLVVEVLEGGTSCKALL